MLTHADVCSLSLVYSSLAESEGSCLAALAALELNYVSIRQHTSAYASIRLRCVDAQLELLREPPALAVTPAAAQL